MPGRHGTVPDARGGRCDGEWPLVEEEAEEWPEAVDEAEGGRAILGAAARCGA